MDVESADLLEAAYSSSWMAQNDNFKLDSEDRLERLRTHWVQATACFQRASSEISESWWNRIKDLYGQKYRAYHTLVHLEELFGFLDILDIDSKHMDYNVMALAILFHDAIYDVQSGENEDDSAKIFQEFCSDVGDSSLANLQSRVVEFILATKHHKAPKNGDEALAIFLDIDMAVLSKDASAYAAYAGLIRQEYIHVDRAMYCEKRVDVLQKFLEEPSIFSSRLLNSVLEARARANLQDEIDMLKQGIIPREMNV